MEKDLKKRIIPLRQRDPSRGQHRPTYPRNSFAPFIKLHKMRQMVATAKASTQ